MPISTRILQVLCALAVVGWVYFLSRASLPIQLGLVFGGFAIGGTFAIVGVELRAAWGRWAMLVLVALVVLRSALNLMLNLDLEQRASQAFGQVVGLVLIAWLGTRATLGEAAHRYFGAKSGGGTRER